MTAAADSPLDPAAARAHVDRHLGPWNSAWEHVAARRPEFVDSAVAFDRTAAVPRRLSPKVHAFIRLTLNAAVTHFNEHAARRAIRDARDAGASADELAEVLMVASTVSVHGMNADVLADVLHERGDRPERALTEEQVRIRSDYTAVRGYWRDFLDDTLEFAPEFLEAYLGFSGAPWRNGVLEPKVREFLYLAFDTAPTHLHMTGLRIHIHNALDLGADVEEIIEVMSIAATMGLQTLQLGMTLLDEEVVLPETEV